MAYSAEELGLDPTGEAAVPEGIERRLREVDVAVAEAERRERMAEDILESRPQVSIEATPLPGGHDHNWDDPNRTPEGLRTHLAKDHGWMRMDLDLRDVEAIHRGAHRRAGEVVADIGAVSGAAAAMVAAVPTLAEVRARRVVLTVEAQEWREFPGSVLTVAQDYAAQEGVVIPNRPPISESTVDDEVRVVWLGYAHPGGRDGAMATFFEGVGSATFEYPFPCTEAVWRSMDRSEKEALYDYAREVARGRGMLVKGGAPEVAFAMHGSVSSAVIRWDAREVRSGG